MECLAWELNGYFIALSGNTDQLAAYYCIVNLSGVTYFIGVAFSIICRTRMNILIGMGEHRAAKNYFHFFVWLSSIVGVFIAAMIWLARAPLTRLYADSTEGMKNWFMQLLFVTAFLGFSSISVSAAFVGLKSVGKINLLLKLDAIFFLGPHPQCRASKTRPDLHDASP